MKKAILATTATLLMAALSTGAMAEEENVNYGDPTASFSTLGVSASENHTQLNGMYGAGSNIFQLDLGFKNKTNDKGKAGDVNYRGRYFHVTDGLGYSVDVLGGVNNFENGDKSTSNTVLAGLIYKFQVTDNISVFPMASMGYTRSDMNPKTGADSKTTDTLFQGGVYAMYGFDDGHWVYVNPKVTHMRKANTNVAQVEAGGGFMVAEKVSVGAKVEYTAKNDKLGMKKDDTVGWLQANYYF
ncbi:hypothetical protein A3K86_18635 [Photobacterium jeanii]|uniref:Outer membrane protein beta-barrel domain-containing protein n=1 Tax=Photobacterium jeanii TaxID=858640 RepID=A0A178K2N0_9GAMM|nr:hypothetical protein [Photobacterium jeanii]OAN10994.1 hypothetical protein A3K86_18635 [Photobacterium jeanii]PST90509.1 hypothetical protein C9I91_07735 [Photobacterium jeanii]